MIVESDIPLIKDRRLSIHAEIRFNPERKKKLTELLLKVSTTGETRWLTNRDRFFSYCKERDVWYGSETAPTHIPYKSIDK